MRHPTFQLYRFMLTVCEDPHTGRSPRAAVPTVDGEAGLQGQPPLCARLADALSELRRVRTVCLAAGQVDPPGLRSRFPPWERGRLVASAAFVLDDKHSAGWQIPGRAIQLAAQVLQAEKDCADELLAAAMAGVPWQHALPGDCLKCGSPAAWHFALAIPADMPVESSWRLLRPENAIPLCPACMDAHRSTRPQMGVPALVAGLWGARFAALQRWYLAVQGLDGQRLPTQWDRQAYPLWPAEFGGHDWRTGSGALACCAPRRPDQQHLTQTLMDW